MLRCIQIKFNGNVYKFDIDIKDLSSLYGGLDSLVSNISKISTNNEVLKKLYKDITKTDTSIKPQTDFGKIMQQETLSSDDVNNILDNYINPNNLIDIANFCKFTGVSNNLSYLTSIISKNWIKKTECGVVLVKNGHTRLITNGERFLLEVNSNDTNSNEGVEKVYKLYTTMSILSMLKSSNNSLFSSMLKIYNDHKDSLDSGILANYKDSSIYTKLTMLYLNQTIPTDLREEINKAISNTISMQMKLVSNIDNSKSTISWYNDLANMLNFITNKKDNIKLTPEEEQLNINTLDDKGEVQTRQLDSNKITIENIITYAAKLTGAIKEEAKGSSSQERAIKNLFNLGEDEEVSGTLYPKSLWEFFLNNPDITKYLYSKVLSDVSSGNKITIYRKLINAALESVQGKAINKDSDTIESDIESVKMPDTVNFTASDYITLNYFQDFNARSINIVGNKSSKKIGNSYNYYSVESLAKDLQKGTLNSYWNVRIMVDKDHLQTVEDCLSTLSEYKSVTILLNIEDGNLNEKDGYLQSIINIAKKYGHHISLTINNKTPKEDLYKLLEPNNVKTNVLTATYSKSKYGGQQLFPLNGDENDSTTNILIKNSSELNRYAVGESLIITEMDSGKNNAMRITITDRIPLKFNIRSVTSNEPNIIKVGEVLEANGKKYVLLGNQKVAQINTKNGTIDLNTIENYDSTKFKRLNTAVSNRVIGNKSLLWFENGIIDTSNNTLNTNKASFMEGNTAFSKSNEPKFLLEVKREKTDNTFPKSTLRTSNVTAEPIDYTTQNFISQLKAKLRLGTNVKIFNSESDLEELLTKDISKEDIKELAKQKGFTANGIIYLNGNTISLGTYMHELTHVLLAALKVSNSAGYNTFIQSIKKTDNIKDFSTWLDNNKYYLNLAENDQLEEYAAHLFEEAIDNLTTNNLELLQLMDDGVSGILSKLEFNEGSIASLMKTKLSEIASTWDNSRKNKKEAYLQATKLSALKRFLISNEHITKKCG